MSELLVLAGLLIAAASGVPGLFFGRFSMIGQWLTTIIAVFGAGLGLMGVGVFWSTGDSTPILFTWSIPGAELSVAVDGLSAIFLLPIFLISLLGNIYGLEYWKQTVHPQNGRKLRLFYGTMTAGMALLVIARNSILFLFGWEIMALSAFFLVTTEDQDKEVRAAGWVYFVATHFATLALFALFAVLHIVSGTFTLAPLDQANLTPGMATAIFVLAIVAFGLKAGIMPLHIWLPSAHAMAPSHVSAIMSGVIIKMGIYGLVRMTSLFPNPPLQWGGTLLVLGMVSGILGVVFAISQHDVKRLLAYHSIENIGIIVMGLGLALLGRSNNRVDWIILGLSGCLLHVWNHAFFKALLFLSAGSVIHAVHTREIDHLGGLAKSMRWTSLSFMVGAVAICGLPPLNGFVSELFIYLGLFGMVTADDRLSIAGAALGVSALALIGGLALACFVKVYGIIFLGTSRSDDACHAVESPATMLGPMGVLMGCCVLIGLAPSLIAPILQKGISAWAPGLDAAGLHLASLAPLNWITTISLLLITAVCLGSLARRYLKRGLVAQNVTWSCGYVAPTPKMQYTSSSFAQMLVGLFSWVLRPRSHLPSNLALFPKKTDFYSHVSDLVLDEAVLPTFRAGAWLFSWFHVFQRGSIQIYLFYIILALIVLLLWR